MTCSPSRNRIPVALKDARYVKPYATSSRTLAWRSSSAGPGRSAKTKAHGPSTYYHVMIDRGVTACRPFRDGRWIYYYNGISICENTLVPIGQVPPHMV